ncbi:hypothetical protein AN641_02930 [Candidatus Epulonipiscioides gigas]|nr:hypothetical protein AN641_02930 [Epulopiscium sp. SCG-C07WGA-EpuloA2]
MDTYSSFNDILSYLKNNKEKIKDYKLILKEIDGLEQYKQIIDINNNSAFQKSLREGYDKMLKSLISKIEAVFNNKFKFYYVYKHFELKEKNVENVETEIQKLEQQIKELMFQLDLNEKLLKQEKENVVLTEKMAVRKFIKGDLLDNFDRAKKDLIKLSKYNKDFKPYSRIVRQYMNFIDELGIRQIESVPINEFTNLTYDKAKESTYYGTPFDDETAIKQVKVISQGWIYEDIVISQPEYIERSN